MKDFRSLRVWEKSHRLALAVYKITRLFPKEELYGLSSQIRRSCVSIPSNIAEGCGRSSDADFKRFLQIAMGSACEVDYQLLLAGELGYCKNEESTQLGKDISEVKQMLSSVIKKLRAEC